jgi:hypothetical protein
VLLHLDLVPEAPLVVEAFNAAVVVAEVRLRGLAYQQAELQPNPHAYGGMVFDQQDAPGGAGAGLAAQQGDEERGGGLILDLQDREQNRH